MEGIAKHETEFNFSDLLEYNPDSREHLEAQIANVADEIAYSAHDLDDGLRSGIITVDMCEDLLIWKTIAEEIHWVGQNWQI